MHMSNKTECTCPIWYYEICVCQLDYQSSKFCVS